MLAGCSSLVGLKCSLNTAAMSYNREIDQQSALVFFYS